MITEREVIEIMGINKQELNYYLNTFRSYFPEPEYAYIDKFSKKNLSFLMTIVELFKYSNYSKDEIKKIIENLAENRGKDKQKKVDKSRIDELNERLNHVIKTNEELVLKINRLEKVNEELIQKNRELQNIINDLMSKKDEIEAKYLDTIDKNKKLSKKVTKLAGIVLKLKKENNNLKEGIINIEKKLSKPERYTNDVLKLKHQFEELYEKQLSLIEILEERQQYITNNNISLWKQISHWFGKTQFKNSYDF